MKLVTFESGGKEKVGVLETDRVLDLSQALKAAPVDMLGLIESGTGLLREIAQACANAKSGWMPRSAVTLRAPIPRPRKNIFCIGRNYKEHIIEAARSRGAEPTFPKIPEIFSKPFTAVVGPNDGVIRHAANTQKLDYEVEFAIVIGKQSRDLNPNNALDAVFGYTVFNDVSARDAQMAHGQWFKGKSFDTFGPMGPCIVPREAFGDWKGKRVSLKVNDEVRQDSNTSDMLFGVPDILTSLSASLTLHPGDVIATGTPAGVALGMSPQKWLQVGDVMEAEIEGIGVLRNTIVA